MNDDRVMIPGYPTNYIIATHTYPPLLDAAITFLTGLIP